MAEFHNLWQRDPEMWEKIGKPRHPDVQPRYYNGSIVLYAGEHYRVDGRSIDDAKKSTYTLTPVVAPELEPPAHLVSVGQHADWRIGSATPRDGDPLYDVPEAELEAIHSSYIAQSTKSSAGGNSDGGTAVDGTNIERS